MNRRDFVRLGCATVIGAAGDQLRPALGESVAGGQVPAPLQPPMKSTLGRDAGDAIKGATDFTLRIAPMLVELAPQVVISTIGYSNKVPGPLLRMREGQRATVEVVNDTDVPEYVHWHGLFVPSEMDGAEEEGTPPVPPHGRRRYHLSVHSQAHLDQIALRLNQRPRKTLGFQPPASKLQASVASTV